MQKHKVGHITTRERVLTFLTDFVQQNGYSPSIREIGEAIGLRSSSTVYNHIRRLKQEGLIAACDQKPCTLTAAHMQTGSEGDREVVQQRVRIDLADGGAIYLDFQIDKPRSASVDVSFDGVLDAKQLKGKVSQIVAFSMEASWEAGRRA